MHSHAVPPPRTTFRGPLENSTEGPNGTAHVRHSTQYGVSWPGAPPTQYNVSWLQGELHRRLQRHHPHASPPTRQYSAS
eukprot:7795277-Pyramimonas_sp.AAC.1